MFAWPLAPKSRHGVSLALRTSRFVCAFFSPSIIQSLAWKSIRDIETNVIETMNELLEEQEALERLELARPNPRPRVLSDIRARITRLKGGIGGWQKQVDRVDDLYKNAGKDSRIKPVKNLVSNQLLQKNGADSVMRIDGSKAENANEIRDISAISFVGGGSSIQYTEEFSYEVSSTKETGNSIELLAGPRTAGDPKLAVVKLELSIFVGLGYQRVQTMSEGTSASITLSRAFTFSDPDHLDQFDVKVFRDPVYGTPFFVTQSGRSKFVFSVSTLFHHKVCLRSQQRSSRRCFTALCIRRRCGDPSSARRARNL
jgi:hypothetical protein